MYHLTVANVLFAINLYIVCRQHHYIVDNNMIYIDPNNMRARTDYIICIIHIVPISWLIQYIDIYNHNFWTNIYIYINNIDLEENPFQDDKFKVFVYYFKLYVLYIII